MATWPSGKGKGLQNPDRRFDSGRRLFDGESLSPSFGFPTQPIYPLLETTL